MNSIVKLAGAVALLVLAAGSASAQLQIVDILANPGQPYVLVTTPLGSGFTFGAKGIAVSSFASASDTNNQMNTQINALNNQISRAVELSAVAAAMKDAIPNTGDRFAIRLNAAGFSDQIAGAIGLSYNLNDATRVSVNYGQGRSQAIVSGGLNLSFR